MSDPRPFDVLGYVIRGPFTRDERAVLLALLVRADASGGVDLTTGQVATLAGGIKPLGEANVRSRVARFLEAAGVLRRTTTSGPSGRRTHWRVDTAAVQKVPRLHDVDGAARPEALAWRSEVEGVAKAARGQVSPAVREQARRASSARRVRSQGSRAALGGPIGVIGGSDLDDRRVRSSGAEGPIAPIGPILPYSRRALLSPDQPYSALYPQTPTASAEQFGARAALATLLQAIDGFRGVRTEGSGLVVEVAGTCVPTAVDELVDRFRAEHGVEVTTEVDESVTPVMLAWTMAKARIRRQLTAENFAQYFEPLEAVEAEDGLVLRGPERFLVDWTALHYGGLILDTIAEVSAGAVRVFVVGIDGRRPLARPEQAPGGAPSGPQGARQGPERVGPRGWGLDEPERATGGKPGRWSR